MDSFAWEQSCALSKGALAKSASRSGHHCFGRQHAFSRQRAAYGLASRDQPEVAGGCRLTPAQEPLRQLTSSQEMEAVFARLPRGHRLCRRDRIRLKTTWTWISEEMDMPCSRDASGFKRADVRVTWRTSTTSKRTPKTAAGPRAPTLPARGGRSAPVEWVSARRIRQGCEFPQHTQILHSGTPRNPELWTPLLSQFLHMARYMQGAALRSWGRVVRQATTKCVMDQPHSSALWTPQWRLPRAPTVSAANVSFCCVYTGSPPWTA